MLCSHFPGIARVFTLGALVGGCALGAESALEHRAATPAPAPAPAPTPVAAARPTAAPTVDPGARVPVTGAAAGATDAPRLVVVASADSNGSAISLAQTTDGQVFATVGPLVIRLAADGSVSTDPTWTRGIRDQAPHFDMTDATEYSWFAHGMGGSWPEGAYLTIEFLGGGRGSDVPAEVYRRSNARWTPVATRARHFDWYPSSFGLWSDGSLLALKAFSPRFHSFEDDGEPSASEQKQVAKAIAAQKRLVVLRGKAKAPAFGRKDVRAFASLPTGQIYAAVVTDDVVSMLHYDASTSRERNVELPGGAGVSAFELEIRSNAADRVWLFGEAGVEGERHGYVASFDGVAWQSIATPCTQAAHSGSIDDSGAAHFVCDVPRAAGQTGPALLRVRGNLVEELPVPVAPQMVVARSPTDVWVLGSPDQGRISLFHSGTTQNQALELPDASTQVFEWADDHPLDQRCMAVWIPLVSGADRQAVAKTIDALTIDGGHPELIDARVRGRVETGVVIQGVSGKDAVTAIKRVVSALGQAAGTATCNQRPPA